MMAYHGWLDEVCGFCDSKMVLAWSGETPFGARLHAYICPRCFSTRFVCNHPWDPVFQMLQQIQEAFMKIWKREVEG